MNESLSSARRERVTFFIVHRDGPRLQSFSQPMSTARILHDARQLIERVGWTQHSESDGQGVCLVGALLAACKTATGFPYEGLAEPLCLLRQVIGNSDRPDWSGEPGRAYNELEQWNDKAGRTYADIVAVLTGAEHAARRPVSRD
jgi:hypothetical protein